MEEARRPTERASGRGARCRLEAALAAERRELVRTRRRTRSGRSARGRARAGTGRSSSPATRASPSPAIYRGRRLRRTIPRAGEPVNGIAPMRGISARTSSDVALLAVGPWVNRHGDDRVPADHCGDGARRRDDHAERNVALAVLAVAADLRDRAGNLHAGHVVDRRSLRESPTRCAPPRPRRGRWSRMSTPRSRRSARARTPGGATSPTRRRRRRRCHRMAPSPSA